MMMMTSTTMTMIMRNSSSRSVVCSTTTTRFLWIGPQRTAAGAVSGRSTTMDSIVVDPRTTTTKTATATTVGKQQQQQQQQRRWISSDNITKNLLSPHQSSMNLDNSPPKQELVFGKTFTDHMLTMEWNRRGNSGSGNSGSGGWSDPQIVPYGDLHISPAASCLHYGTYTCMDVFVCLFVHIMFVV